MASKTVSVGWIIGTIGKDPIWRVVVMDIWSYRCCHFGRVVKWVGHSIRFAIVRVVGRRMKIGIGWACVRILICRSSWGIVWENWSLRLLKIEEINLFLEILNFLGFLKNGWFFQIEEINWIFIKNSFGIVQKCIQDDSKLVSDLLFKIGE
jgi:hypothetical protein